MDFGKRCKVAHERLIDELITVGKIKDVFYDARLLQTPHDLKGRVGFAGTRGHHEKKPLAPVGHDGVYDLVDGRHLVVAGNFAVDRRVVKRVFQRLFVFGAHLAGLAPTAPEIGGRRKGGEGNRALQPRFEVVFDEFIPGARVSKGDVEHLGVRDRLI